ncbi:MAG: MoaD/ThiS family protein [Anaerolineales bacterium]|nr:MoaD/ThiS family protein [Anaerolineales bacterium]
MKINFYATLRPIVGGKTVEVPEAAGRTVLQLIEALVERFPALRRELYKSETELWPHVHFFVNGRDARYLADGLDYVIKPEDTINIFPPVGGG